MKGMKILSLVALLSCLCIFSGCAKQSPRVSHDEWLRLSSRTYNAPSKEVYAAIENIFDLADGEDVTITHRQDGLEAVRWTAPFPVHVWFHWHINIKEQDKDATKVFVTIDTTAHGFGVPAGKTPYQSFDVVNLFFKRLDYLLGESKTWVSCKQYEKLNPDSSTLEALCLLAKDEYPSTLSTSYKNISVKNNSK